MTVVTLQLYRLERFFGCMAELPLASVPGELPASLFPSPTLHPPEGDGQLHDGPYIYTCACYMPNNIYFRFVLSTPTPANNVVYLMANITTWGHNLVGDAAPE